MLLIDGVKYELWIPPNEDEIEQVVKKHTQEIFGEESIYLDLKQKLKSRSGIGSIPDGYVIVFGDSPQWHIVEVELSSHPLDQHIVSQVSRFIAGIKNAAAQKTMTDVIYQAVLIEYLAYIKMEKRVQTGETYKFLSDIISKPPVLTIIIEKDTEELREAISTLAHPEIKVIEFQTFIREGVGLAVHAHLFEPLCESEKGEKGEKGNGEKGGRKSGKRVTVKDLMDSGIVEAGQTIYGWYKGRKYEATILLPTGRIQLAHDDSVYNSPSASGKRILGHEIDGWTWWRTTRANGEECLMDELRKEYRATHPNNS
ncbi:MAG: hypothetical protein MUO99_06575 [Dehalococcoidales bacterium]|nr:hypothetical protein [Dehalococcoidales bacterium]